MQRPFRRRRFRVPSRWFAWLSEWAGRSQYQWLSSKYEIRDHWLDNAAPKVSQFNQINRNTLNVLDRKRQELKFLAICRRAGVDLWHRGGRGRWALGATAWARWPPRPGDLLLGAGVVAGANVPLAAAVPPGRPHRSSVSRSSRLGMIASAKALSLRFEGRGSRDQRGEWGGRPRHLPERYVAARRPGGHGKG